ncbi:MAG: hypothetical protein A2750_01610 [Candidatus Yanofskybacteria bacterium RIFCSPHIGHO2_01_FULL_45_42]|uniref:PrgI family protein n=1 Tax=Candidatus Yanofskybacteria bacterium RIFCSPHIGHO2_01_FULL_45_42 TaxID=1802671 RepID=A0A1F8F3S9_9BACT|nr:MAG: hypothetical protein A2750_01610 [Candidatus Yanofskybacteria bacterium RIFCSPHIGHO2_01_FULL_45_42]OGN26643.1 MAG: hypothetical protein A3B17_00565 [Candidatus Yanofskybacteria bacterium RIFCSPLOWO2_01_FULL_45_72]
MSIVSRLRFQLPQFIQTEIKIVGPFTLKQFLWVATGGTIIFLLSTAVKGTLFFTLALPVAAIALTLALVKIDDQPMADYIARGFSYLLGQKKYVFREGEQNLTAGITQKK